MFIAKLSPLDLYKPASKVAPADVVVETVDPPKTAHSDETHGRFLIAAEARP